LPIFCAFVPGRFGAMSQRFAAYAGRRSGAVRQPWHGLWLKSNHGMAWCCKATMAWRGAEKQPWHGLGLKSKNDMAWCCKATMAWRGAAKQPWHGVVLQSNHGMAWCCKATMAWLERPPAQAWHGVARPGPEPHRDRGRDHVTAP
jgi:hypothetical protein